MVLKSDGYGVRDMRALQERVEDLLVHYPLYGNSGVTVV
jgi:hypothetical protein